MNAKLLRLSPKSLASNPRASLASWTKYESIIIAAFRTHPKTYIYSPAGLSPATVCTRARDAVRGCLAFQYPTSISHGDLEKWFGEVVFKFDKEKVYIGPILDARTSSLLTGDAPSESPFTFSELSFEEIVAFSVLLSSQKISGPITIHKHPDITLLPPRPNVETIQKDDGTLVLL